MDIDTGLFTARISSVSATSSMSLEPQARTMLED